MNEIQQFIIDLVKNTEQKNIDIQHNGKLITVVFGCNKQSNNERKKPGIKDLPIEYHQKKVDNFKPYPNLGRKRTIEETKEKFRLYRSYYYSKMILKERLENNN
jgi:hypothetical protein